MPRKQRRKPITVEAAGISVRLFKRGRQWWGDVRLDGVRERTSLDTRVRGTAEDNARSWATEVAKRHLLGVKPDALTLGQLFAAYRQHRLGALRSPRRREATTRMAMFLEAWGVDLPVADVDQTRVQAYVAARRTLRIVPPSCRPAPDGSVGRGYRPPKVVRAGGLDAEFRWLNAAINWACGYRSNGAPLLQKNPLPRDAKSRRKMGWPVEKNPRRPVAAHDRYTATQQRTDVVDPAGRLRCILALARYTARRETAICKLFASDVLPTPERIRAALAEAGRNEQDAEHMLHGAIRWREDSDKQGLLFVTPLGPEARTELDLYLRRAARVGDVPLFPAPGKRAAKGKPAPMKPDTPIRRDTAAKWLLRAEQLAGVPKLRGGVFHPYRRLWAIERRHLPAIDVAAAGGWGDTQALTRIYQRATAAGVAAAVAGS